MNSPVFARITEERLQEMRMWEEDEAATELDERIQVIESQQRQSYVEIGLIVCEMEDRKLFRRIIDPGTAQPFTSLDRWIITRMKVCRSTAYAAKGAIRELRDMPREQLEEMPRFAIEKARKLPPKRRQEPSVIEALKTSTEAELDEFIQKEIPEAHLEGKTKFLLTPDKSQRAIYDSALEAAEFLTGAKTKEDQLEAVAGDYLITHQSELEKREDD